MKKVILIIVLFLSQQLFSQNTLNRGCVSNATKHVTYNTTQENWKWSGVWYFKDKETGSAPCEYREITNITQIDSIGTLKIVVTYNTIDTKKTIVYAANDTNWIWCNDFWTYKGVRVEAFPAEYKKMITQKSEIESWEVGDLKKARSLENKIVVEYYCVQSDWTWCENSMIWLYKNKKVDVLPVYRMLKTETRIW